jgi:hypothetical protein
MAMSISSTTLRSTCSRLLARRVTLSSSGIAANFSGQIEGFGVSFAGIEKKGGVQAEEVGQTFEKTECGIADQADFEFADVAR